MAKFIVRLQKVGPKYKNAFRISGMAGINVGKTVDIDIREWEITADSAVQVRDFFNEALSQGHPNVQGYEIRSITQIEL